MGDVRPDTNWTRASWPSWTRGHEPLSGTWHVHPPSWGASLEATRPQSDLAFGCLIAAKQELKGRGFARAFSGLRFSRPKQHSDGTGRKKLMLSVLFSIRRK